MIETTALLSAFVTLFVVIDPIGLAPIFIALTTGMTPAQRRRIAVRACATAFIVLMLFAVVGEDLLGAIGIGMPAFKIAGGILLFMTALDMLFERRTKRRNDTSEAHVDDPNDEPSVFPLAIPLIAGPGAITSVILIAGQNPGYVGLGLVAVVTTAVIALVLALWMASSAIERALGPTAITVITRLLGMLLAALSVQFVLDGLQAFTGFAPITLG